MNIVAERTLICRKPNGEERPITLRIEKPVPASDVDWSCRVSAEGLLSPANIHGIDSFQALTLGTHLLRSLLENELNRGHLFFWPEEKTPMSLEAIFGKAI